MERGEIEESVLVKLTFVTETTLAGFRCAHGVNEPDIPV